MRSTVSFASFFISKFECQRDHVSSTRPITWPGLDWKQIIDWKQHGMQQNLHENGRYKWKISVWWTSITFISNGRAEPQHWRVKQSVSSSIEYTCMKLYKINDENWSLQQWFAAIHWLTYILTHVILYEIFIISFTAQQCFSHTMFLLYK